MVEHLLSKYEAEFQLQLKTNKTPSISWLLNQKNNNLKLDQM
jgi:hypothetical protein